MSNEVAIKVDNITKVYKLYNKPKDRLIETLGFSKKRRSTDHYALNGVSFDVKKGETVGIIGTNGSGKSTILKIITGVLSPTDGKLTIDGRISALLELGAGFNQEYTGMENIYLNGTMIGFTKDEIDEKLQDILDFADIGDFVYQPVKTYSSGMFVRLAFAVAINIDPEILIVDEALSVGDVFFQNKCYKKFEDFKAAGKTVVFVSHDLSSIAKYCDRVILLNKGDKLAEGGPKEMVNLYKKVLVGQAPADLNINPDSEVYGDGKAEVFDIFIEDENGIRTNTIIKGTDYKVGCKVKFNEPIKDPIVTYTVKDIKGTDICGTNTMFERVDTNLGKDVISVTFKQHMNLQGGEYLLSFSCTGFEGDTFVVHQRRYDAVNMTVISEQNKVGFFDMESEITVE